MQYVWMECYPTQLALVAKYEELREDSWPTELRPTQVLCGMPANSVEINVSIHPNRDFFLLL